MPCRRVSFSGSSPRTGRSRFSSIRRGWRSGSRSRSPAESDSRHTRVRPSALGERVPRRVRSSLPICGLLVLLTGSASLATGPAAESEAPPGNHAGAAPVAAPPAPSPSPSPVPPGGESPPAEQPSPPEAQEPHGEAEEPRDQAGESKGVIGRIVVDGNVRVSDTAFFSNLHLKAGDPYDERAIQD